LAHLAERAKGRRRVAVLGDMAELGLRAPEYHREVGAAASELGVDALLAVGPLARGYLDGADGIGEQRWVESVPEALHELESLVAPGDCVLVKASRAMGLEAVANVLAPVADA